MKCLEEVRVDIDVGTFVFFGKGKMKDVQDVYFLGRINKQDRPVRVREKVV